MRHYCVYVILPWNGNVERHVMSLLKITVPGLPFDEFEKSDLVFGGRWDGVLLKERSFGNQLSNNIIEIKKLDFDFFLPFALVTPDGHLHDVEMIKMELEYIEKIEYEMDNPNEDGEFVPPNVTEPLSLDEQKNEYDLQLRHLWKEEFTAVTSKYPGHLVVCCDVYGM